MKPDLNQVVTEVDRALAEVKRWTRTPAPDLESKGARAYEGIAPDDAGGWRFLIVIFNREDGAGAAGTATRSGTGQIVWLTPEMAAKAAEQIRRKR